jgi:hypothetical protein
MTDPSLKRIVRHPKITVLHGLIPGTILGPLIALLLMNSPYMGGYLDPFVRTATPTIMGLVAGPPVGIAVAMFVRLLQEATIACARLFGRGTAIGMPVEEGAAATSIGGATSIFPAPGQTESPVNPPDTRITPGPT